MPWQMVYDISRFTKPFIPHFLSKFQIFWTRILTTFGLKVRLVQKHVSCPRLGQFMQNFERGKFVPKIPTVVANDLTLTLPVSLNERDFLTLAALELSSDSYQTYSTAFIKCAI